MDPMTMLAGGGGGVDMSAGPARSGSYGDTMANPSTGGGGSGLRVSPMAGLAIAAAAGIAIWAITR